MAETINGVEVPPEVEAAGRDAIHAWWTEYDQTSAVAAFKASGLKADEITRTGAGGKMLTSDVERALHAKALAAAAKAAESAPAETPAVPAPKAATAAPAPTES
jgi:hypothetical protein